MGRAPPPWYCLNGLGPAFCLMASVADVHGREELMDLVEQER